MANIAQSEVGSSVFGNSFSDMFFGTAVAEIAKSRVLSLSDSSAMPSTNASMVTSFLIGFPSSFATAVNENLDAVFTDPKTVRSFWERTENMIVGSQEWNALYRYLPEEKQRYLQSYSRLYDSISNPIDISGTNYNFASDSSGLSELATYLEKVSIEVEEIVHEIYEEIQSIGNKGDWEGEAFLSFQETCLKYKEPLTDLVQLIKSFSSIFASLDEETNELVRNIDMVINENSTYTNTTDTPKVSTNEPLSESASTSNNASNSSEVIDRLRPENVYPWRY